MRRAGRTLLLLAVTLAGLSALAGAGLAALQLGPVQQWLAGLAARAIAGADGTARLGRIEGVVPFDFRLAELGLSDRRGEWLTARGIAITLAPQDLLRRRLTVQRVAAGEIALLRMPEVAASPSDDRPGPPALPHLPVDLHLDRLQIDAIHLAAPVLGEPVDLTAYGHARLAGGDATVDLAVHRIDGADGSAGLSVVLGGAPLRLTARLAVAEPSGLLLARLLGRDDRPPLAISLAGEGPLDGWRGRLEATAGALAAVEAEVAVAGAATRRIDITGRAAVPGLLPPGFGAALPEPIAYRATLELRPDAPIRLQRLWAGSGDLRLEAAAVYGRDRLDASATVTAKDLLPLSVAAGAQPLTGAATLRILLAGPPARPRISATLETTALGFDTWRVERTITDLALEPEGDLADAAASLRIAGQGQLHGATRADGTLPHGLDDSMAWHLTGSLNRAAAKVEIAELQVTTATGALQASGRFDGGSNTASGKAILDVADLAPLSALAGRSLAGHARLDLAVHGTLDGIVSATIEGSLAQPRLGDASVDALLGDRLQLTGAARRDADGRLTLDALRLATDNVTIAADGNLAGDRLAGHLVVDLPRLAVLAAAMGQPMAGRIGLKANLLGPLDRLALDAELDGEGLAAGPRKLDRLHLRLDGSDGAERIGRLDGTFRSGAFDGTLAGRLALSADLQRLDLSELRLTAGGSQLRGRLSTRLGSGLTSGELSGQIADLAPFAPLTGMALAGRGDFKAVLDGKHGQAVDLSLTGSGIKIAQPGGEQLAIDRITARARVADLLGKPSGHGSLDITQAGAAGATVSTLSLKLDSVAPNRLGFNLEARGRLRQPVSLTAGGELRLLPDGATLALTRLSGELAGQPLELRRPLQLARKGNDLSVTDLDLRLGRGRLAGSGALRGERLTLDLQAERLPIAVAAAMAGQKKVTGELGFDARLVGTRSKPEGRLVLDVKALRMSAGRTDLPALSLAAEADWRNGRVVLSGQVADAGTQAVKVAGSVPLELAPMSLRPVLPPAANLALALTGAGDLAALQEMLPIGEDRLAGKFALDIRVGGTVAAPAIGGALRVSEGRYESMAAGTVLTGLRLDLVGNRERLVIERFQASDGERGQLTLEGAVDFAASPGPAVTAQLGLRSFRILRRDDANLLASGALRVGGPLTALRAVGELRAERGELRIPDRLPPSVTELRVVQINSRTGERLTPERIEPPPPPFSAALDLRLVVPGEVFVRGRGLDSEWRGTLGVSGTTAQPIIVGMLQGVRGSMSLLGKTFNLSQGVIRFDGGQKIDPVLDILAEAKAADITGTVQLTGTASAPALKIGSDPELPQDEVLARILFGKRLDQVTPAQGIRLAAAAASLAGGGGGVMDKLRGALALDRLDIGASDELSSTKGKASSGSALGSATVSAGKYIAQGVYLGVDQGTSTNSSRARVEVEIMPNLSVETDVGASGGTGLGLVWKKDY